MDSKKAQGQKAGRPVVTQGMMGGHVSAGTGQEAGGESEQGELGRTLRGLY